MGLIKTALLLGGGIYAVKKVTKSQEKKYEMQKNNSNNNNNQDMYLYGGGQPGQGQQYQQQQQQGPGLGSNYNRTRECSYPVQEYGHGQSRGQSPPPSWEHANGHNDFRPAYAHDEKKRMN
ncbi:hypothetical protein EYB26_006128 [Talaromyces marneffei]|uniref:uncharacterized protein n=1 Tax=Talaromyces marneffei TaxID=37727 RepID=UPI0012AA8439|nr:uncharacterized protein EYB26_006128 [Talaromyces marneffei]QGA18443.1 hypothetical protein EYB26_006128 [Talaromyces marneffei]